MPTQLSRSGTLFEIDDLGIGFIEDRLDQEVYGFHASMLNGETPAGPWLEGREVTFQLEAGMVRTVVLKGEAARVSAGA